jgi:hypothetical protein
VSDLALGHIGVETQEHDLALTLVEGAQARRDRQALIAALSIAFAVASVALGIPRQWDKLARQLGPEHNFDALHVGVEGRGKLSGTGEMPPGGGELAPLSAKLAARPLQVARNPHQRRFVPQVPANLAVDHPRGKRREGHSAALVETLAGLHEPHRADLNEVLDVLSSAGVATRDRVDERKVGLDETLPRVGTLL